MTRASDVSTYDDDFFAWTQEQAAALRRLPREVVGDTVDIAHVAEEIEDLGKRDLREVSSYLARLFEHLMKIDAFPTARETVHWRVEALNFQMSAAAAFSPSMRRLIDVEELWRRGRKLAIVVIAKAGAPEPSTDCPLTLDDLLNRDFEFDAALAKLAAAAQTSGA